MSGSDADRLREWVACWKRAGPLLEELRREEIRHANTQQALIALAGAFESARLHHKPSPTSGLVEQQRWFKKLAARSTPSGQATQDRIGPAKP